MRIPAIATHHFEGTIINTLVKLHKEAQIIDKCDFKLNN